MKDASKLLEEIRLDRMANDLWELVNIPSPTGSEHAAARAYGEMLRVAGAQLDADPADPARPSVVARLKGKRPGRRLQLAGHLDHIPVPHEAPTRDDAVITGRGSADMKGGLAAIVEIVRALSASGRDFPGEILITAYGLHEAPVGDSSTLIGLIQRGIVGNAAIVMESDHAGRDKAVIAGAGQAIWNVSVRRAGLATHELNRPPEADGLLECAMGLASALRARDLLLRRTTASHPLLRPESLFIGQMHYGDFYNRAPQVCTLQGTRRWQPDCSFDEIRNEMRETLDALPHSAGITVSCDWRLTGDAYEISPDEAIVRSLRSSWQQVTGMVMPAAGTSVVTDANRLVTLGKIPAVLIGFDNERAHADHESIRIERLLKPCQAALLTALTYLESVTA